MPREYLRDVGRFLKGQRPTHPRPPTGYLDAETEAALGALAVASQTNPDPARLPLYAAAMARIAPRQIWRASAVRLYRNWLAEVAKRTRVAKPGDRRFADPAA